MGESAPLFGLVGAAGFVAPRHLAAIQAVGGDLRAAYDPADSVGVLDSFFPNARFFTEFERFDRHIDKAARAGEGITHLTVCSPNHLHDAHVRFGLRAGADVICEKPLVLNPWNLDGLAEMQSDTGRRLSTILQLRLHPSVIALRERVAATPMNHIFNVDLDYITARGAWYFTSWKGDEGKSGGVATNIGVHFFDMLIYVFGPVRENVVHLRAPERCGGWLRLARAQIRWFLSVDAADLPADRQPGQRTWRALKIDGDAYEFSQGFSDLHNTSYREILAGRGFGVEEVRPSIELVSALRNTRVEPMEGDPHPSTQRHLEQA